MVPQGPPRGPMQGGPGPRPPPQQQQQLAPQQAPSQYQPHQQDAGGAEGGRLWDRIKGKVFQGDDVHPTDGAPSFRPKGSKLAKKQSPTPITPGGYPGGMAGMGAYMPAPGMMPVGDKGDEGPGTPEFVAVDDSIVYVGAPNALEAKKRKFRQEGQSKMQVISVFDSVLTSFMGKEGSSHCLKTTELLEQNQHVMLPEAAKKIRFLRSEFRRRMEAEGKEMPPAERVKALEEHLRKVYGTAAMEGGIHMNSIGPAIEAQLDRIPLRAGTSDMLSALAYRGIPTTIFCPGYGNVAMEVMRRGVPGIFGPNGSFNPHLRLISNFFRPDDTLTIIGMFDAVPLVHEWNKNAGLLEEFLRAARMDTTVFSMRGNIVLIGSDPSDMNLIKGLQGVQETISVGFLKMDADFLAKLPRFAAAFDVVVLGDGDMSYVNEILLEVTGS
jgi:hypothetical protein